MEGLGLSRWRAHDDFTTLRRIKHRRNWDDSIRDGLELGPEHAFDILSEAM